LISALVAHTQAARQADRRRFLEGLSGDELRFIAEYLGACILQERSSQASSRDELAARVAEFQAARGRPLSADEEHKMVLLLEFLCRGGAGKPSQGAFSRAPAANAPRP
jgi:hypothetical protein